MSRWARSDGPSRYPKAVKGAGYNARASGGQFWEGGPISTPISRGASSGRRLKKAEELLRWLACPCDDKIVLLETGAALLCQGGPGVTAVFCVEAG